MVADPLKRQMVSDMGPALIALKSADDDWVIPYAPRHMDSDGSVEFRYVEAVIEDAARRFPIDTKRLMAAGFSAGGMMVWNLACTMPERFAGFAAIAGTFWMHPGGHSFRSSYLRFAWEKLQAAGQL